jgi:hypothetical protein
LELQVEVAQPWPGGFAVAELSGEQKRFHVVLRLPCPASVANPVDDWPLQYAVC